MSIVVSEFRALVEARFGSAAAQALIGGDRTAGPMLDLRELHEQVQRTAAALRHSPRDLWRVLGVRLFTRCAALNANPAPAPDALDALAQLESSIGPEVRALYSDTHAPGLHVARADHDTLVITYTARRQMGDLLEGLIRGCVARLGERVYVRREEIECATGSGARFVATRACPIRAAA